MTMDQVERAKEITAEIKQYKREIDLLPEKTHQRTLRFIPKRHAKESMKKKFPGYVWFVETYCFCHDVVRLTKEELDLLVQWRLDRIATLEKELAEL